MLKIGGIEKEPGMEMLKIRVPNVYFHLPNVARSLFASGGMGLEKLEFKHRASTIAEAWLDSGYRTPELR